MDGEDNNETGEEDSICKIAFIVGLYDEDDNYQGYKDVMNIIEKVKQRLKTKRFYSNQFELKLPLKWVIHEEDIYPYYFGGIESSWKMPIVNMDDTLI